MPSLNRIYQWLAYCSVPQVLSVWAGQKCRHYKLYKEDVSFQEKGVMPTLTLFFYLSPSPPPLPSAEGILLDSW